MAATTADAYGRKNLLADLTASDRAWWPQVRKLWRSGRPKVGKRVDLGSQTAASSGYARIISSACGRALLQISLMVTVGPSQKRPGPHCSACNSQLFMIDRRGHVLIYFVY